MNQTLNGSMDDIRNLLFWDVKLFSRRFKLICNVVSKVEIVIMFDFMRLHGLGFNVKFWKMNF